MQKDTRKLPNTGCSTKQFVSNSSSKFFPTWKVASFLPQNGPTYCPSWAKARQGEVSWRVITWALTIGSEMWAFVLSQGYIHCSSVTNIRDGKITCLLLCFCCESPTSPFNVVAGWAEAQTLKWWIDVRGSEGWYPSPPEPSDFKCSQNLSL